MTLPSNILDMVEMRPPEEIALAILRERIQEVPIGTLIPINPTVPFVIVRSDTPGGRWPGDERFVDAAFIDVQSFCAGVEADSEAALLNEACRVAIRDAFREQRIYPNLGSLCYWHMVNRPARKPDWATAVGPVQYADLPGDWTRYDSRHYIEVRRPF